MTALEHYTSGFRLIDGDQLNLMVDEVNNLSGGGTAGPVTATTLSASGVASFANGLVGTPALTFTSDPDTGFYRVGANSLGIAVGGALVGTWASTGLAANVDGILGGNSPAAATVTTLTASTGINGILGNTTPAAATVTTLTASAFVDESAATALTAAGTTRTDALALTKAINNVTTAGASTGVVLPASATVGVGGRVVIYNNGANAIKVYAAGSDTIDGTAGSSGVTLTNALRCEYRVIASGAFLSAKLGATST